jgi:Domain of unknown function (DUF4389)
VSTTSDVTELSSPERHPIHLVVTDDLERNRLTVFFRLLLALPHFVWLAIWGIAVFFAVIAGWFVSLVMGRLPDSLHAFLAAYDRYQTHVNAYFFIAANPFPSFTAAPGYPVDVDIAPAAPQSRLTIFFRLLLAIPAFIVLYVLQLVGQVVGILAWFYALFTGSLNRGMRDLLAYWLRYQAQTYGYAMLLTGRYPSFSDE